MKNTKICLYAHDWNYIDNYAPVINFFNAKNISYDIFVLQKTLNDSYSDYKSKYKDKYDERLIDPYRDGKTVRFIDSLNRIPTIGVILKTILLLWFVKKFFKRKNYSHLVVSDDRIYNACIVVSAARKAGVQNVIMYPVEGIQTIEDLTITKASVYLPLNFKKRIGLMLSKMIYPPNVARFNNEDICFLQPKQILQLRYLNIFPKNPWLRGTNKIDRIAVNSEIQKEENCKHGMNPEKISVTGFPPYDDVSDFLNLKDANRQRIKKELGIDKVKKIFLIMGTHYSDDHRKEDYKKSEIELNNALAKVLELLGDDFALIFKSHPRIDGEEQKQIFDESVKQKIIFVKNEYSVYELVSVADAIMNFVSASTIASLATDVPILAYKLRERANFKQNATIHKSVVLISNQGELEKNVMLLKNDLLFNDNMKKLRKEERKKYGTFDGRNTERFLKLLFVGSSPDNYIY